MESACQISWNNLFEDVLLFTVKISFVFRFTHGASLTLLKRTFVKLGVRCTERVNIAGPRQHMPRVVSLESGLQLASGNLDLQRVRTTQIVKSDSLCLNCLCKLCDLC